MKSKANRAPCLHVLTRYGNHSPVLPSRSFYSCLCLSWLPLGNWCARTSVSRVLFCRYPPLASSGMSPKVPMERRVVSMTPRLLVAVCSLSSAYGFCTPPAVPVQQCGARGRCAPQLCVPNVRPVCSSAHAHAVSNPATHTFVPPVQVSPSLPGIYRSAAFEQATDADAAMILDGMKIRLQPSAACRLRRSTSAASTANRASFVTTACLGTASCSASRPATSRTVLDLRSQDEIDRAYAAATPVGRALFTAYSEGASLGLPPTLQP